VKLVRHIARTGIGRREAMERIRASRVTVNGRIAESASMEVDPARDRVLVDGRRVGEMGEIHLVVYKPRGTICTRSDPEGRRTIYDLLPPGLRRASTVGRLDYNTTGAVLLVTDGELARRLELPRMGVSRTYRVKLRGQVTGEILDRWRRGVEIGGRRTRPARVEIVSGAPGGAIVRVTLREGRNRQIHEMAEAVGLEAVKIHRMRFGTVDLAGLRPGGFRPLDASEVEKLRRLVGL